MRGRILQLNHILWFLEQLYPHLCQIPSRQAIPSQVHRAHRVAPTWITTLHHWYSSRLQCCHFHQRHASHCHMNGHHHMCPSQKKHITENHRYTKFQSTVAHMLTRCDDQVAVAFWCECKVVGSSHVPSREGECNNTCIIRYRYSAGGTKCAILRLSDIILFLAPADHVLCCDIESHTRIRANITFSSQICRDETCLSGAVTHDSSYILEVLVLCFNP